MNVRVIFVTLILVSVLAMSNLSENLAFAAKEDKAPKVDLNALQKLIDDLVAVIDEIRAMLETLQTAFDTEVIDRTEADNVLQAQIDELKILYESETEADATATISPYYTITNIATTASGTSSSQTISCEDGDKATSANLIKLVNNKQFLQVFSSFQPNDSSWTFLVVNTHPAQPIDIELSVNCLRAVV